MNRIFQANSRPADIRVGSSSAPHKHASFTARSSRLFVAAMAVVTMLTIGIATNSTQAGAATQGPCDILGATGAPCVGAFSSVRAMYGSYGGPLYQVTRASDGATTDIGLVSSGGYANAAAQDSFCAGTVCTITKIYDQSSRKNDLTPGILGTAGSPDIGVRADLLPVKADGNKVYGMLFGPGTGYRIMSGNGVATNGQPESMYAVVGGSNIPQVDRCCFDFGNAEITAADTGNGHMDALNISDHCTAEPCTGAGPWFQADLENATFMGNGLGMNGYTNPSNVSMGWDKQFLTGVLRNDGMNFALDGGSANAPGLTSLYAGPLPTNPSGYIPMRQEGGIVLGIGGDNSNAASGAFFEGAITQGYAPDAAIAAVQTNVAAVGYEGTTGGGAGALVANPATGGCLDVVGVDNGISGAAVDISACVHDSVDQRWTPTDGMVTGPIRSLGMCLDVSGGGKVAGTPVVVKDCAGTGSQNWTQTSNGTLVNVNSGLCLTGSGSLGTQLTIGACTGGANQQFLVEYAYQTIDAPAGKCIDVYGENNGGNNAKVDIWDCLREAADQYWLQNPDQSITTLGRCLDVSGGARTPGTLVELYDCNGNGAQKWVQQANGTLVNPQSGLCLTAPNTSNGTQLDIEACTGNANQRFSVGSGHPINAPGGKCVDVAGDDTYGNWQDPQVWMWDCNLSAADQHWVAYPDQTIRTLTRCLDVDGNSKAPGSHVGIFNCNGLGGQKWAQRPDGTLVNPQSGLCLTDPGSNTANGTLLDIEACTGGANQQFSLQSTTSLAPGNPVSLRATTSCCTASYVRHQNGGGVISTITSSTPALDMQDASWIVRPGLANSTCLSFESKNFPNGYLRQSGGAVYQQQNDKSQQFATDATFCPVPGHNGQGVSLQWLGDSTLYLRHYQGKLYVASNGGSAAWNATGSWSDDTSWMPMLPWAP